MITFICVLKNNQEFEYSPLKGKKKIFLDILQIYQFYYLLLVKFIISTIYNIHRI